MKLPAAAMKELLLLLRDRAALVILFVMPTALVMILTLVQEDAMRAVRGGRTTVLLALEGADRFGEAVADGLERSGAFEVVRELDGRPLTEGAIREALRRGTHSMGIVVEPGIAERLDAGADRLLSRMLPSGGGTGSGAAATGPPGEIVALFDPAVRSPFRRAVVSALGRLAQSVEVRMTFGRIENAIGAAAGRPAGPSFWDAEPHVGVREVFTGQGVEQEIPSSVVQNVPAWSLFAMFMISIPLSGSIIRERDGGTLVRLRTLPVAPATILGAKVAVFSAVCVLQFLFMLAVGTQVLPRLGTSQLVIGTQYAGLAAAALAAALAATGFGIMMGAINRTTEQSSIFCATSVVIAAALGGIMVPSFVMPAGLRALGAFSPLHWGHQAFVDLFMRGGTLSTILPPVLKLLAFGAVTLGVAVLVFRRKE